MLCLLLHNLLLCCVVYAMLCYAPVSCVVLCCVVLCYCVCSSAVASSPAAGWCGCPCWCGGRCRRCREDRQSPAGRPWIWMWCWAWGVCRMLSSKPARLTSGPGVPYPEASEGRWEIRWQSWKHTRDVHHTQMLIAVCWTQLIVTERMKTMSTLNGIWVISYQWCIQIITSVWWRWLLLKERVNWLVLSLHLKFITRLFFLRGAELTAKQREDKLG